MNRPTRIVAFLLALAGLAAPCYAQTSPRPGASPGIRYVEPNAETGTSMATVAGEGPVARTAQLLPFDAEGRLVGAGDAGAQIDRVLENLRLALAEAGADLEDLLKVNVYAARTEVVQHVQERFAQRFAQRFAGEAKPAVSFVVTDLPQPEALVAMDAVAVAAPPEALHQRAVYHADALGGGAERGHVAVLPAGSGAVYVSGLYGDPAKEAEGQMRDIFARLGPLLEQAGTDFDHLAKATYYLDSWDVKGPLWGLRKAFYDPERPPTSSLIPVRGVGKEGALVTIDVVGVVPE